MKKLHFCFTLILATTCLISAQSYKTVVKAYPEGFTKDHWNYLDYFRMKHSEMLGEDRPHGVHSISIKYDLFRQPCKSVEEARMIIVECMHSMVSGLNAFHPASSLFKTYPLTPDNFLASFTFKDENDQILKKPYIARVDIHLGRITYQSWGHEEQNFIGIHSETFSAAEKLYNPTVIASAVHPQLCLSNIAKAN